MLKKEGINTWMDDFGQVLYNVHERTDECEKGCVIHSPSAHSMTTFKRLYRSDRGLMERICPHGIGHPDPDDLRYKKTIMSKEDYEAESVHGCDGCCKED
jgi:hypothetical protein